MFSSSGQACLCVMMGERVRRGGSSRGEAVGEIIVVTAAPHSSIRAQWSGDLWVWLHPPRLAADPQCCGTQEQKDGKITETT